jgi:hypothetical protein
MNTCMKCEKKGNVNLGYTSYCDNHFLEVILKRIRKNLLGVFDFKKEYKILKITETTIAKRLLNKIYNKRLNLIEIKEFEEGCIIPTSLDEECSRFMQSFFENKEYEVKNAIYPLRVVLRKELGELARIFKLKYEVKTDVLDDLEENHPGTKFATLKSLEFYEKNQKSSDNSSKENKS